MYGWTGTILSINLTTGAVEKFHPPGDTYRKFIGGKGLAGHFLKDHITEPWDSPEMPLLFFTGPLIDTPSPTSGRMCIMSRSPQTGTVGDTSVGGMLGAMIKRAGYDGIIITGKSAALCGITVNDGEITIAGAAEYAGLTVSETFMKLPEQGSAAVIGPAAEKGVWFSNIAVDRHHFAGRNGLGLVMAGKNIKYLHVHGSVKCAVYDKDELKKAREDIFRLTAASPILQGELGISEYGTGALYDLINSRRMMPTDNFSGTYFPGSSTMNAWAYKEKYRPKKTGCPGCHILCKKIGEDKKAMPEFETMAHFSALIGNNSIETVVEANRLCNEYGMDTITAASTISCYAKIGKKTLNPKTILELLEQIAYSKGIGEELKEGSYRYSLKKGAPEESMSVKGLELPAYDPRGAYGMALAYATSTRGGCHLRAYPISHEILRKPVATDRFTFSGKARIIKLAEDLNAVVDSLTACKFIFFAASLEEFARAYSAVTGIESDAQDLMKTGERNYYNERIMNAMNGFSIKDDILPEKFFTGTGTSGEGITIGPIDRHDFDATLQNYYKVRGLDREGRPTAQKCRELDLAWKS